MRLLAIFTTALTVGLTIAQDQYAPLSTNATLIDDEIAQISICGVRSPAVSLAQRGHRKADEPVLCPIAQLFTEHYSSSRLFVTRYDMSVREHGTHGYHVQLHACKLYAGRHLWYVQYLPPCQ
jgi:hypothetical protein